MHTWHISRRYKNVYPEKYGFLVSFMLPRFVPKSYYATTKLPTFLLIKLCSNMICPLHLWWHYHVKLPLAHSCTIKYYLDAESSSYLRFLVYMLPQSACLINIDKNCYNTLIIITARVELIPSHHWSRTCRSKITLSVYIMANAILAFISRHGLAKLKLQVPSWNSRCSELYTKHSSSPMYWWN